MAQTCSHKAPESLRRPLSSARISAWLGSRSSACALSRVMGIAHQDGAVLIDGVSVDDYDRKRAARLGPLGRHRGSLRMHPHSDYQTKEEVSTCEDQERQVASLAALKV